MAKEIKKNKLFDSQQVDHYEVIAGLVAESSPRKTFLLMIFISSVIATMGLLNDSPAVVIGAMLVAPLLWPFLGISMGLLVFDWRMIRLSFLSIFLSIIIAVITAMFITSFYVPLGASREILNQTNFNFMWPIALAAGAAAAFAISYSNIREAAAGIAISVALLPPLVTVGIGLGGTDWVLMQKAGELFMINLVGILGVTFIVFWLLGFRRYHRTIESAVKKEEKILKA
ncbi:TIGR00341 family protein [Candidatus Uhrbacteria bacterium CG_4_9_14_0_2_um_filter_41_50]|uniref:TIGR00341 family protein n=1 Tax=Candidatus Uhrbacteria bacterium CG_4_9_14_0_2_um_filter_41_50 TaxID=1975031 RepID=A0A2M8EPW1_9BACT|nr:MAG: TIGR00341 family protein [Candidatus Uhrbacteria bacterium CG_4_10_14_3_um_filter_41_21]PIZ54630.1 MAG: TIGR00341 family protein [Candidatus Uhrbacteria bacterium CG_4_10_14_0_2_um_filter_41_21]PJB84649.1 MAG: TIGR00341 family protein [Candidatus Uhrbacteria bacterium CG_4_9_14_0_8_um_filter_41_16]PJC24780.1 MAG: TIGR00341 family protein [Candidatus Uhrbacteria bacterium CG_4_9_14_0_2_um_filter_41_50]PJE75123.1 MAG: TIGR00341 family protein [Candidatus Uhrbacteria bacterium CG10_big_fil